MVYWSCPLSSNESLAWNGRSPQREQAAMKSDGHDNDTAIGGIEERDFFLSTSQRVQYSWKRFALFTTLWCPCSIDIFSIGQWSRFYDCNSSPRIREEKIKTH
jgi:hypothetical protein